MMILVYSTQGPSRVHYPYRGETGKEGVCQRAKPQGQDLGPDSNRSGDRASAPLSL